MPFVPDKPASRFVPDAKTSRGPQSRPRVSSPTALERIQQMSPGQQMATGGRAALELAGRTLLAPVGAAAGLLRGAGAAMLDPLGRRSNASAAVGETMNAVQGLIPQTQGMQAVGEMVGKIPGAAQVGQALQHPVAQPLMAGAEILGAGAAVRPLMRGASVAKPTAPMTAAREIQSQGGAVPRSAVIANPESATGAMVQRIERAGRDLPSGEIARRGADARLSATNRSVILKHAGIDANRATPEVLSEARERIGAVFENVYDPKVTVPKSSLDQALTDLANDMPIAEGSRKAVEEAADRIVKSFENGSGAMNGTAAKELRAWLMKRRETAYKGQAIDAADALGDLIDGLDDAVYAASPPGARAAIGRARYEWRSLKAIEHATDRGLSGDISTRKLASYLSRNKFTRRAYAANEPGSLESLARAFDTLQDKFPNSGTASRAASVAEPVAAFASGGASLPASVANMATQRYLAGPAGPLAPSLAPSLARPNLAAAGMVGLLGNFPYGEEE